MRLFRTAPKLPRSPDPTLTAALRARFDATPSVLADVTTAVHFEVADAGVWSVHLDRGRLALHEGRIGPRPTLTIQTDRSTLESLLDGTRSGIDAFLDGHLRTRGDLALALKLESVFERPGRPAHLPRPRRARALGIDTFYLEAGEGPPVVLLHGLGATNASMLPVLRDLSRDHRVIAPDLPGFGASGKPLRRYHAAFFAEWAVKFLDAIAVERAHFVGNSLGGRIALEIALRAPERAERLALLMPSMAFRRFRTYVPIVRVLRPELAVLPLWVPRQQVTATLRAMFSRPDRLPRPWYEGAVDQFLHVFASPRGRIGFFSAAREIYLEDAFGQRGFWDRLPSLSRPALFIWGDRDRLVPMKFARHVASALPNARSVILSDCGHVPQFELPDRTHALVREFFGAPGK